MGLVVVVNEQGIIVSGSGRGKSSSSGRAGGYRFVRANPDAAVFKARRKFKLPPKVDLRPLMTQVENQGQLSSCTANAIAGAYEYLLKKHLVKSIDIS